MLLRACLRMRVRMHVLCMYRLHKLAFTGTRAREYVLTLLRVQPPRSFYKHICGCYKHDYELNSGVGMMCACAHAAPETLRIYWVST
jgi:hypothetical protein